MAWIVCKHLGAAKQHQHSLRLKQCNYMFTRTAGQSNWLRVITAIETTWHTTVSANPDPFLKPYSRLSTTRHLVCRWGHHLHIPTLNIFGSAEMQGAVNPNEVSAVH